MDNKKIEMTDNEIIKALERCRYHTECCYCNSVEECGSKRTLVDNCLDLIKRLKAEIERLRKETSQTIESIRKLARDTIRDAKSEAIEDFAVKIKKELINEAKNRESCEQCQRDMATLEALELVDRVLRETIKNDFKE